jgi:hypothetical protein
MSVYYLFGKSNYGNSAGIEGYYYPLYTSSDDIAGQYHQHTFEGLDGVVFYMPNGVANHGVSSRPTAAAYNNETYSEYATYNFDLDTNTISYTNRPEAPLVVSSVAQYSPKQTSPYNERTSNKESSAVEDLIPLQLRESAETLTALLEDYYKYLNSNGQVLNVSKRILTEHDIDETSSDYLKKIQQEVAVSVPDSRVIDTVSLYKRIINYYSIRGSEESVLVFFKLFFDEIVEVFYPKDFLLKPSDGDWIQDDNIFNYENTLTGTASNNLLSVDSVGESLKFYNDSDVEIAVGQIQRLEKIESGEDLTHPDTNFLFLEVDTSESERYDPDENTFRVYNPHESEFSQTVAALKNGVSYSQENGFLFTDDSGGSSWDRNHIDLGQIYNTNPEIATVDDTDSHTLVAQIKLNGGNAGPVHLFSSSTNYPGLQIGITNNKLNYETWRWGTGNGYNSEIQSGTTVIPNGEYTTVAVRGKRDHDAIADGNNVVDAAAGDGYIDVSVNGESWERVWDDSDYGTPTSFDIKRAGVYYASEDGGSLTTQIDINGFVKAGTSSNGSDYYEADFTNAVITGNRTNSWAVGITTGNSSGNFDKYVIEYMTAAEINSFYTRFITGLTSSWSGILQAFEYNPDGQVAYGMWILRGQKAGHEGKFFPLQIWVDATPNAVFEVINNRSTGIMHKISQYNSSEYAVGTSNLPYDIYDGTAQVVRSGGGNSLNNSGSQRTSFYQTLIDYEKRMKVLPGYGSNTSTSLRRHTYSPYQLLYQNSGAASRSESVYLQAPQISSQNWVTHGKQITAVTTKEMLDVVDKDASLRLGVRRSNHYFQGNITYFAYYQKLVTASKIGEIHNYLIEKLNPNRWAMRVNVDQNKSLSSLEYLRNVKQTYAFSNISGPLKDAFWSYESFDNNVLSNFSVTYKQVSGTGKVLFGDESPSLDIVSGNTYFHTFNQAVSRLGNYADRKGFASDINKLQDSDFWQDYSYQIRGGVQLDEWESEYLRLVHPAGMKMFSALLMQISRSGSWKGDTSYKVDSAIETEDLKLIDWLQKLVPPWKTLTDSERRLNSVGAGAMHMPFYQPGWLNSEFRSLFILIQALVNGNNPRDGGGVYERAMFLILQFISGANAEARNEKVQTEYKRWTKWFDKHTRVADYGNLTANEINSENLVVLPSQHKETNLLAPVLSWSPGNGNDEKYGAADGKSWRRYGEVLANFREYVVTPFRDSTIGWIGVNRESEISNGGFESPNVSVDITKTYRFSTWIKQSKIRTRAGIIEEFGSVTETTRNQYAGTSVFGIETYTSDTSILNTNGTKGVDANSSATGVMMLDFSCPTPDEWYLAVGFVRPDLDTNTLIHSNDFGLYNTLGEKVGFYERDGEFVPVSSYESATDQIVSPRYVSFEKKWITDVNTTHVSLKNITHQDQSADKNPTEWWGPRIEVVDGSEPSIRELLNPTIEPNVFYNINDRPANRKVKKFNNVSTNAIYIQPTSVHTITTNDYDYRSRNNYNENLKFLDNSKIGAYYNTPISDMVTVTEEGYVSNDNTYRSAGSYSSSVSEYTPPATNNNAGQGGQTGGQGGY